MNIVKKTTQNKTTGRNKQVPIIITCHRTCGSFDGAVSWLCNKESQASSHFVVAKDGRVTQLVEIQDTAWCNGTSTTSSNSKYYKNSKLKAVNSRSDNANSYTVSIEFEGQSNENGELTEVQLNTGVELVKFIVSEVKRIYGTDIVISKETLVGHCDITPQWKPNCPGKLFPFEKMIERVNVEMVTKGKFVVDGHVIEMNRILKDGKNYPELRELTKLGLHIDYDEEKQLPIINSK